MTKELIKVGDKTYGPAQVIMLPTEKSKLFRHKGGDLCLNITGEREKSDFIEPQHLYIVTSEEIKKGDWYLYIAPIQTKLLKATENFSVKSSLSKFCHKVIASTDPSLSEIKDCPVRGGNSSVRYVFPRPSDDFIKKFCELNGEIKDVLVEYEQIYNSDQSLANLILDGEDYTIKLKVAPDNTISIIKKQEEDSWDNVINNVIKINNKEYDIKVDLELLRLLKQYYNPPTKK